jgi:hypothetical protein
VRVIYSDETGVGSITDEPYAVVAVIMLNMNSQWHPVSEAMQAALLGVMPAERAARYEIKWKRLFSEIRRGQLGSRKLVRHVWKSP